MNKISKSLMNAFAARPHPRLVHGGADFLRRQARTPGGKMLAAKFLADARLILKYPLLQRIVTGRRLLDVSRNALYRINTLAAAAALSGQTAFKKRAVAEIRNVCAFSDWNPSHFLDTAEMALAVAVGYDWFYGDMSEADRRAAETALTDKALVPSLSPNLWWVTGNNNWTQVCHAGMTAAALAVADRYPDFVAQFPERAIANLPRSMRMGYAPNGAYSEGTMYWSYGSEFNVLLLSLLETAFGKDFGLGKIAGFNKSMQYLAAATGPSGRMAAYSDSIFMPSLGYAGLWLTRRYGHPEWITETARASFAAALRPITDEKARRRNQEFGGNRMLPFALTAADAFPGDKVSPVPPKFYSSGAGAVTPVVFLRDGKKDAPLWVCLKGGSPSGPHGHMDGGSFIFDALGERWTDDLGMQNYHEIEKEGVRLWDNSPTGDRWRVFRIGPECHNILRFNGGGQASNGSARLLKASSGRASFDLSSLYPQAAAEVKRSFVLNSEKLNITDTISGVKKNTEVIFQFCTAAEVSSAPDGGLRLRLRDKEVAVRLKVDGGKVLPVRTVSCDSLTKKYEDPNPGRQMVRWAVKAGGGKLVLAADFIPLYH